MHINNIWSLLSFCFYDCPCSLWHSSFRLVCWTQVFPIHLWLYQLHLKTPTRHHYHTKAMREQIQHSASTERPRTELWTLFVIRLLSALGFSNRKPPQAWKVACLKGQITDKVIFPPKGCMCHMADIDYMTKLKIFLQICKYSIMRLWNVHYYMHTHTQENIVLNLIFYFFVFLCIFSNTIFDIVVLKM